MKIDELKEYFKERKENTLNQLSSINKALSQRNQNEIELLKRIRTTLKHSEDMRIVLLIQHYITPKIEQLTNSEGKDE